MALLVIPERVTDGAEAYPVLPPIRFPRQAFLPPFPPFLNRLGRGLILWAFMPPFPPKGGLILWA